LSSYRIFYDARYPDGVPAFPALPVLIERIRLEDDVIYQLVRRDIMQESTIYRSIQKDEKRAIALNLLRRGVAVDIVVPSTGLSIEEVQQLQQQINEPAQS
jgi:hypothetical protein